LRALRTRRRRVWRERSWSSPARRGLDALDFSSLAFELAFLGAAFATLAFLAGALELAALGAAFATLAFLAGALELAALGATLATLAFLAGVLLDAFRELDMARILVPHRASALLVP
jgi:hypothetical protein